MDKIQAKNILQQGNYFLYQDISSCTGVVVKWLSEAVSGLVSIHSARRGIYFVENPQQLNEPRACFASSVHTREHLDEIPTIRLALTNL